MSSNWLHAVEEALEDADAELATDLGGRRELTSARLWRGQVLVDWQPDAQAGGCLLRPRLLQQVLAHVRSESQDSVLLQVPGRVAATLSDHHADLVRRMGGARRLRLDIRLRFAAGNYVGGDETYWLIEAGRPGQLLRLTADVRVRGRTGSPRMSPAPR